jgi:hypothetical protein
VGNFQYEAGRTVDINRLPIYVYANPANLVNNTAVNNNSLRPVYGKFPGMGSVTQFIPNLYAQSLLYHAMQLNVQRRLTKGLQMGFAYTLASGNGYTGYDSYTDELGGKDAIHNRYWGPTAENRKHNLVVNYSYNIPTFTNMPVIKQLLSDWQVSGVTRMLSGSAVTPSCTSNNSGIANTNPSLTDSFFTNAATSRCDLVGDPFAFTPDTSLPFADQAHFNTAALRMAAPNGSVGDFGNSPTGILRNPGWHEWDLTLARRFPVNVLGRKNSGVKLQFQAYNIFNEVQFTTLNASYTFTGTGNATNTNANLGKYTATTPPRQMGLTARFDW